MTEGAATPPVFLADGLPAGEHAVLDGEQARHAMTVRRMRAGEQLVLSDGAGGLADCVIDAVRPGRAPVVELRVLRSRSVPAPRPRVVVVQALVKGDRGELAVELATEAGADVIVPWQAARCVARWDDGTRADKALARWRGTARAAAKQARRAWVPEVREPVRTPELAASLRSGWHGVVLEAGAVCSLDEVALPGEGELALIVGPEGGVSADELDMLRAAGATPARLGATVLRASSAAAVALGAIGVLTGRWRTSAPDGGG
ncbi:MAG: 16S rRNA (uracil(1498)-N(3))-methyltransferase [Pseudonocardiaceae bacterium]|nr:16S rRNA (uracil(1498)-N(3))-methyltransferase [Pseudonocardiaceae bacterium]